MYFLCFFIAETIFQIFHNLFGLIFPKEKNSFEKSDEFLENNFPFSERETFSKMNRFSPFFIIFFVIAD